MKLLNFLRILYYACFNLENSIEVNFTVTIIECDGGLGGNSGGKPKLLIWWRSLMVQKTTSYTTLTFPKISLMVQKLLVNCNHMQVALLLLCDELQILA